MCLKIALYSDASINPEGTSANVSEERTKMIAQKVSELIILVESANFVPQHLAIPLQPSSVLCKKIFEFSTDW